MKCKKCGRGVDDAAGVLLVRVNPKGQPGEWECRPVCGAKRSFEENVLDAIGGTLDAKPYD